MQESLKLTEGIPEYLQIQMAIQTQIEEGILTLGERLPSDKVLANAYGVSIGTVIKSISNLAAQGFVARVQGKGTFVTNTGSSPQTGRFYCRRTGFMPDDQELSVDTRFEAIIFHEDFNTLFPGRPYFGTDPAPVYELRRRVEMNNIIYSRHICYISSIICPKLENLDLQEFESHSLHRIFRERYGITTTRVKEMSSVGFPNDDVASLWEGEIVEPYLCVQSLDYSGKGRPHIFRIAALFHNSYKLYREF